MVILPPRGEFSAIVTVVRISPGQDLIHSLVDRTFILKIRSYVEWIVHSVEQAPYTLFRRFTLDTWFGGKCLERLWRRGGELDGHDIMLKITAAKAPDDQDQCKSPDHPIAFSQIELPLAGVR